MILIYPKKKKKKILQDPSRFVKIRNKVARFLGESFTRISRA